MDASELQVEIHKLVGDLEEIARHATRISGRFALAAVQSRLNEIAREVRAWSPSDERDDTSDRLQELQRMLNLVRENLP